MLGIAAGDSYIGIFFIKRKPLVIYRFKGLARLHCNAAGGYVISSALDFVERNVKIDYNSVAAEVIHRAFGKNRAPARCDNAVFSGKSRDNLALGF